MKVTGSMRAIKVLAMALVLSVFAIMATSCTSCTMDDGTDTSGEMESTILTTETTTPLSGTEGGSDTAFESTGEVGGTTDGGRVEETTGRSEDTSGLIRRLF